MVRRGFLALIGNGACIWFPGSVVFGLIGLLIPVWGRMLNIGRGPLGLIMTFLLIAVGIFMFISGRLSDVYGARKVATAGSLVAAGALALFIDPINIYFLYLSSFIFGLGITMVYISTISSVQRWFPRRKGMAAGFVSMLYGLSAFFTVPIFNLWLEVFDSRVTILLTAILTGVVGVLSAQFTEFPERLGLTIHSTSKPSVAKVEAEASITLSGALRTKTFWLVWATWALCGGSGIGMAIFSTSISIDLGLAELAPLALVAFNLTNGLSRIISGILSDKFGRVLVMFITYLLGSLGFFLIPVGGSYPYVVLASNLMVGLAFGTLFSVSAPFVMECFGIKHYGSIFGFTFTAYGFIGSWLGPFIGGFLRDFTGTYTVTCIFFAIYCLLSAVFIALAKPSRKTGKRLFLTNSRYRLTYGSFKNSSPSHLSL